MALATVYARAQAGMAAPLVRVEVDLAGGIPGMTIVGLPETAVKESRDRVRAAIRNSGYDFPRRRVTVNLAPADLPKEGGRFDLAIALGVLAASGQVDAKALVSHEFLGELSLSGKLRPVSGGLPAALAAGQQGRRLVVPVENGPEAGLAGRDQVAVAEHLTQVAAALAGAADLPPAPPCPPARTNNAPDLAEVRGQHQAKRALEIAAVGGHSLLFTGPPGSGKTMLASRLPGILPPMTDDEAMQAATVISVVNPGTDAAVYWRRRPFRAPHHTASGVALVGGGSLPRPGEITLAHQGVLFLDELPEFDRRVLEVLREPLESGCITISRAAHQADFPARFQLVAAMNPCPCGYLGDSSGRCHCGAEQVARYRGRISGPLLDRIDLHVSVARVRRGQLSGQPDRNAENSSTVRARVIAARSHAAARGHGPNASLEDAALRRHCQPSNRAQSLLDQAMDRLGLSARGYHRVLKVARSIADLAASEAIDTAHVAEAISLRSA